MPTDDSPPADPRPVLQLAGITKRFPGVLACDDIDLEVMPEQVHAIVGENGAGKSTLMSVLYGLFPPDEGKIFIRGEEQRFASPLDAMAAGLGMVFQAFKQFPSLTVAENVVFKQEPTLRRLAVNRKEANRRVADLGDRYGLSIDPTMRIEDLSVGERQRVEILKALYRNAQILILDEPTAVLTPQETDSLFGVLRQLKLDGLTIVFITHKLREVMELSDQVAVLRRGRLVAKRKTAHTDPTELAAFMTGRTVDLSARPPKMEPGPTAVELSGVTVSNGQGIDTISDVSFKIGEGEILGIAAIAGNGQEDLMRAIAGLSPITTGSISIRGTRIETTSVAERREQLIAYVPEDRHGLGSASDGSISDNLLMGYQHSDQIQRRGWLRPEAVRGHAADLIDRFGVVAASATDKVAALSGGNLQKVIVAREMGHEMPVLLAEQPTRGVDIGAIEFIHSQIVDYRDRGGSVLLVSAELGELMTLSTRILVMYEGRIVAELDPRATTESEIGLFMSGANQHDSGGSSA